MSGSNSGASVTSDLIIRARDLASEPIEKLVQRVQSLSAAIEVQSKLAERGEGSTKALALAIRQQEEAVKALVSQQGKLDQFLKTSGNVEALKAAQQSASDALDTFKNKLGEQGVQTKAQKDELRGLENALKGIVNQLRVSERSLESQSRGLERLGVDTKALAAAQELLNEARARGDSALARGDVTQANAALLRQKAEAIAAEVASNEKKVEQIGRINARLNEYLQEAAAKLVAAEEKAAQAAVQAAERKAEQIGRINARLRESEQKAIEERLAAEQAAEQASVRAAEKKAEQIGRINARLRESEQKAAEERAATEERGQASAVKAAETKAELIGRANARLRENEQKAAEQAAAAEARAQAEAVKAAETKAEQIGKINARLAEQTRKLAEEAASAEVKAQAEAARAAEAKAEQIGKINARLAEQTRKLAEEAASAEVRAEAEAAKAAETKAEQIGKINARLAEQTRKLAEEAASAEARAQAEAAKAAETKAEQIGKINARLAEQTRKLAEEAASVEAKAQAEAAKAAEAKAELIGKINARIAEQERKAALDRADTLAKINEGLARKARADEIEAANAAVKANKALDDQRRKAAEDAQELADRSLSRLDEQRRKSLRDQQKQDDADREESDKRRLAAARAQTDAANQQVSQLGRAPGVLPASTEAGDALARLLAPAAVARGTLAGVTAEVDKLHTAMGAGDNTAKRYHDDLQTLGSDRSALARIAQLIDAYRGQEAATRAAQAALGAELSALAALNSQVQAATTVDAEMTSAVTRQAAAVNKAREEFERQNAAFTKLRASVAGAGLNYTQLNAEMGKIANAAGKITDATNKTAEALRRTGGRSGKEVFLGLRQDELYNLSYQINDVFTSLASGISLAQTAAQQSGQIIQLFERPFVNSFGSIRQFTAAFGGLPVVIGGVVVAVGAAITAFSLLSRGIEAAAAQRNFEARLAATADSAITTGTVLVATTRQIQQFGSSFADAQKAVQTFLNAGVNPSRLVDFGKTAQNVADITGKSLPEAAKEFAGAFSRGFDAVVELDKQFHFLTASTYEQIKALYEEKGSIEGGNAAYAAFAEAQQRGADKAKGEWSVAIRGLTTAWHNFLDALANTEFIQTTIQELTALANAASYVLRLFTSAKSAAGDANSALLATAQADVDAQQAVVNRLRAAGPPIAGMAPVLERQEKRLAQLAAERDRLREVAGATQEATVGEQRRAGAMNVADENSKRAGVSAREYLETITEANNRRFDPNLRGQAAVDNAKRVVDQFQKDEERAAQNANGVITREIREQINVRVEEKRRELAETIANYKTEAQVRQDLTTRTAEADAASKKGSAATADDLRKRAEEVKRYVETVSRELRVTPEQYLANPENAAAVDRYRERLNAQDKRKRDEEDAAEARRGASANNKRLNAEETLQAELLAIKAKADAQDKTNLEARLRSIDEEYAKTALTIAKARRAGVTAVGGQSFDEFAAQIEAQKDKLKAETTLQYGEAKVNALLAQRKSEYAAINEELAEGTISVQEAFTRTTEVTSRLGGEIRKAAQEAVEFAKSLPDQTPKVQAFIAKNDRLANQSPEVAAKIGEEGAYAAALKQVNDLVKERTELETAYRTLARDGFITGAQAEEKIREAYEQTTPKIRELTGALGEQLEAQRKIGAINDLTYNTQIAKIAEVRAKSVYASDEEKAFYKGVNDSFVNNALQGFNTLGAKLGEFAAGTAKLGDVFRTAGQAFAAFTAGVLRDIAQMILKTLLLKAIQAAGNAVSPGLGNLLSGAAGAATSGGGGAFDGAGASGSAVEVHTGGLIGSNDNVRRPIDPAWFANAPRFHSGGIVGLQPDERAAILQTGEQVLSRSSVRDMVRGATAPKGPSEGASRPIRQVLVFDKDQISQALAGSHGEEVVLTHIKNNAGAVRQIVR